MKIFRIKNRRNSLATNSSSTHSVIYKNKEQVFEDLGIFDNNYYDRGTETIAATREAKIRYIFANIFYWDELVEMMSVKYPEMKEYYPLVKNHFDIYNNKEKRNEILYGNNRDDNKEKYWELYEELESYHFGEHSRGQLFNPQELYLSYEYLCNIIDSPDIVIVGGSDEADFVYEQTEGCEEISSEFSYLKKITDKIKNGNYYILYGDMFGKKEKVRLQVDSIPDMIPEYPELVDMKITNACEHKCPFCYMGSTPKGNHAEWGNIHKIINLFKKKTEFALGGGNVLLHPDFKNIVKYIYNNNHIANITIRYDDIKTINESTDIKYAINKYVSGIGISVQKENDIDISENFINDMLNLGKHICIHIIPEMIGVNESVAILKKIAEINEKRYETKDSWSHYPNTLKVLFLGFKQSGRAKNIEHKLLTDDELNFLRKESKYQYNVDTAFINTYINWFKSNYDNSDLFLTRHEGEFSMYIDAVKCKAFASSYKDDVAIDIKNYDNKNNIYTTFKPIEEVFGEIRKNNGFKVFEKPIPYYRK
jgi:organic radical activating enzyme